jgi:hypothetical protein
MCRKNNVAHIKISIVSPSRITLGICLLIFILVMPVMADLNSDHELKNDKGSPYYYWFMRSTGHTVFFNNSNPLTITGIRIYGCKWVTDNENTAITVSIMDENLQTLYQEQVPYLKVPMNPLGADNTPSKCAKWADIPLSGYVVNGNFSVAVFTDSYPITDNRHGIYIGFNLNSEKHSSHSILSNPNRIMDLPMRPSGSKTSLELSEIDWMIRVLYNTSRNTPLSVSPTTHPIVSAASSLSGSNSPVQTITTSPQGSPDQLPMTTMMIGAVAVLAGIGGGAYLLSAQNKKAGVTTITPPAVQPSRPISSHHDVFISYAHGDKPVADGACAKLEARNIRCWMAPRDVPPGMDFPAAIMKGIEGSRVMVLVFSSHSNVSPHVLREITSAVNKGIIIVPFRIEDITPSKSMEYLISVPHWLDAITPPMEQHFDQLAGTIENILSDVSSHDKET